MSMSSGGPTGAGTGVNLTLLVHEAWIKLSRTSGWDNRAHFFASASRAMRQVLVDEARTRSAQKRSGSRVNVDPDRCAPGATDLLIETLAVHEALSGLAGADERAARVTEMRLFGDVALETIAEFLGVTLRTIQRDRRFAQAWLADAMEGERYGEREDLVRAEAGDDVVLMRRTLALLMRARTLDARAPIGRQIATGSAGEVYEARRDRPAGSVAVKLLRASPLDADAARAVHHANLRGIVHRDLKPSNILIDHRGCPRIVDFGVARLLDAEGPGAWACARTSTPCARSSTS